MKMSPEPTTRTCRPSRWTAVISEAISEPEHHQITDGGGGREIGNILGADLGFTDRVGDGGRHLAVAVGRLARAVERVVTGLDSICRRMRDL